MARFLLVLTTMVRMMRTSMPPYPASAHLGIEIHVTLDDWRENKDQTRHALPRMGSYRSGAQCGFSPPHFPLVAFDRGENDEGKRLARTQGPNSARTAARAFVSGGVTGRAPRACRLWLCFQRGSHTGRLCASSDRRLTVGHWMGPSESMEPGVPRQPCAHLLDHWLHWLRWELHLW